MTEEEKLDLKKRLNRHWEALDKERTNYKDIVREQMK